MGFKAPKTPASQAPQAVKHLKIQTSAYGEVIPLVYGVQRVAGNILWAGFFKSIRHDAGGVSSGSKAGGRVVNVTYTYTASVIIGLGEGASRGQGNYCNLGEARPGVQAIETDADGTQRFKDAKPAFPGLWKVKKVERPGQGSGGIRGAGFHDWATDVFVAPAGNPWTDLSTGFTGNQALFLSLPSLRYGGVAVVTGQDIPLGSNTSFPNFNFPLDGLLTYYKSVGLVADARVADPRIFDADPAMIALDFLTNTKHGAGLEKYADFDLLPDWITGANSWSAYCRAWGIFLSPVYDSQQSAAAMLEELATITNTAIVWSEGVLKMLSYGDVAHTSGPGDGYPVGTQRSSIGPFTGTTFNPSAGTATYGVSIVNRADLGDDDFLVSGTDAPIAVERNPMDRPAGAGRSSSENYNHIRVECVSRRNAYAVEIAEAKDDAHIAMYGLRSRDPYVFHAITVPEVAREVAQRMLQRGLGTRPIYRFKLGWRYLLLEPMDVVTVSDPAQFGTDATGVPIRIPVRIRSIEESEDGALTIEAEDFPNEVGHAVTYQHQGAQSPSIDYNVPAPPISQLTIFEPPFPMAEQAELWIVAGGVPPQTWGGAVVMFSEDGADYRVIGEVFQPNAFGQLDLNLAASTAGLDVTHTTRVLLANGGALADVTLDDAEHLTSLCYVGNGGNDYELFAFSDVSFVKVLVGINVTTYAVNAGMVRGVYGTLPRLHLAGENFLRLDGSGVLRFPIDMRLIGRTVYLKFLSFNPYGAGEMQLADAVPIPFTVEGKWFTSPLANVTNVQETFAGGYAILTWDPVNDVRGPDYEIRLGTTWETARILGRTSELRWAIQSNGTYWIAAHVVEPSGTGSVHVYSANPVAITVSGSTLVQNVVLTSDEAAEGWPGVTSAFDDLVLDLLPVHYFRLGNTLASLGNPGLLTATGTPLQGQKALVRGDGHPSTFFDGASRLASDATAESYFSNFNFTTGGGGPEGGVFACVFQRGHTPTASEECLFDSRSASGNTNLSLTFAPTNGRLRVYRATTQIVETTAVVTDLLTHTLVVRTARAGTVRSVTVWLDGVQIASLTTSAWSTPNRMTLGARFDGTLPWTGYLQRFAILGRDVTDAWIVSLDAMARTATPTGLVLDRATNTLRLSGTKSFNDIASVNAEPSIWYAGGVCGRGRYYPPLDRQLTLQVPRPLRLAATADLAGSLPWQSWNDIPSIAAVETFTGRFGDTVGGGLELAVAPTGARDVPTYPYLPLVPRTFTPRRFRARATVSTADPTVAAELRSFTVTTDVDDLVQQGNAAVGVAATLIGTANLNPSPDGIVTFVTTGTVPVGHHVLVIFGVPNAPGPNHPLRGATIDDGVGNIYQYDTDSLSYGSLRPTLAVYSGRVTTQIPALQTITCRLPAGAQHVLQAVALDVLGLASSAWFDQSADDSLAADVLFSAGETLTSALTGTLAAAPAFVLGAWGTTLRPESLLTPQNPGANTVATVASTAANARLDVETYIAPTTAAAALSVLATAGGFYRSLLAAYRTGAPGGTLITFANRYNSLPSVQVAILNAQAGDDAVTSVTASGFTVNVVNGGNSVPRQIAWVAQGW